MRDGRAAGVILAFGIIAGSFIWSVTAAFGVGAILLTHVWILETVRYLGAAYLLYLGFKSLRSAIAKAGPAGTGMAELALVVLVIGLNNAMIFLAYALLFSNAAMARAYAGARRFFESVFALLFGFAGIRILMLRLTP